MKAEWEREYVEYVQARMGVLRRTAMHLAGDAHRGDDLVQQTITKLYVSWRRAREAANLDAYAHKILLRVFLDEHRVRWAAVQLTGEPLETAAGPGPDIEDRAVLRAALAKLPAGQRATVVLRFLADKSVEETAEILGCTSGTVKSQTSAGLAGMRRLLGAGARIGAEG